jgi:hypothetical protein
MAKSEVDYEAIQSQAIIFKSLSGIAHNMAIKCAVDLRLADILHSHENPITLSQLASSIDSPTTPPDISILKRVMRLLVCDKIFTSHEPSDGGSETLYGPTKASLWLLNDSETSLASTITLSSEPAMITSWCNLSRYVKEGAASVIDEVRRSKVYELASQNSEFNEGFNRSMAAQTRMLMVSMVNKIKDRLENVETLVDVGGGIGEVIAAIVKEHPHVKGINFDLSHVISTAPEYNGVTHVGGDMFEAIPKADAIFMKWILHNWNDEGCLKILKKCKEAIPEKGGKIIIAEAILNHESTSDATGIFGDLMMLLFNGGKERTEPEWKTLLEDGGFPRYKIINVNPKISFIEAYPE